MGNMGMMSLPPELGELIMKTMKEDSEDKGPNIDCYTASKILADFDLSKIKQSYKVGDFVTPVVAAGIKGHGQVHRVMMIWDSIQLHIDSCNRPLTCYNMLVSQVMPDGRVNIWAAVSTDYEPFKGLTVKEIDIDASDM